MDRYLIKAKIKSLGFRFRNIYEQPNGIVFVGDSLTARCDLEKYYPKYHTVNRGISGDTLSNLANRMKCSVYDLNPRAIVFLMGINDVLFNNVSADNLLKLYEKTLAQWRKKYATIPILVQSLYPVADDGQEEYKLPNEINKIIVAINIQLKAICERYNIIFVDIHASLLNDEKLDRQLATDCIHLNEKGYEIVGNIIGNRLDSMFDSAIDIYSKGAYPSDSLSNFYPHEFILDDNKYASMEGFLQSLKCKNSDTAKRIGAMNGAKAKKAGSRRRLWKLTGNIYYKGKRIKRKSADFDMLISKAYDSLFENKDFKSALCATEYRLIEHSIGKDNPKKTVLTRNEFLAQLYRLRDKITR